MTWSRRAFVRWGLAAAGLTAVGWAWWRRDAADLIVAILERRVGYLRVDRETFRTFAQAYLMAHAQHQSRLSMAAAVARPLQWIRPDRWGGRIGAAFRDLDDSVVGTYLLSTDFFDHNADETRVVSYLEFFSLHTSACRNPFARQTGTPGVMSSATTARRARS